MQCSCLLPWFQRRPAVHPQPTKCSFCLRPSSAAGHLKRCAKCLGVGYCNRWLPTGYVYLFFFGAVSACCRWWRCLVGVCLSAVSNEHVVYGCRSAVIVLMCCRLLNGVHGSGGRCHCCQQCVAGMYRCSKHHAVVGDLSVLSPL